MIPRDPGSSLTQLVKDGYGNVGSEVQGLPNLGVRSDGSGSL